MARWEQDLQEGIKAVGPDTPAGDRLEGDPSVLCGLVAQLRWLYDNRPGWCRDGGRDEGCAMQIQQSSHDGMTVLTLVGRLDLAAAPQLQRAILKQLADHPPAIVCDLAQVESIDPLCAGVFTSIRHPELGWPNTALVLCAPRPPVADLLRRQGMARHLGIHRSLEAALANARARPPRLAERLLLGPAPTAARAGRGFVRQVCARWGLEQLAEPAALVASELITNAVAHAGTVLELRLELRRSRLLVAVADQDPDLAGVLAAKDRTERGLGLLVVERVATAWGVRRKGAGGKVVWCLLALPAGAGFSASAAPGPSGRADGPGWHRQLPSGNRRWPVMLAPREGSTSGPPSAAGSRDQLAAGLLAEVLQALFGLGLQLQAIGGLTREAEVSQRLEEAIGDLDTILHDLRAGLVGPTLDARRPLVPQDHPGDPPPIGTGEAPTSGTAVV
jgi:anti-anti-sigma factor